MGKRPSIGNRKPVSPPAPGGWPVIAPYALLSLGSFLAALLLIGLLLGNASLLVSLGLEGRFYYLALLPLGLAVTGFLFGAMRSFALYRVSTRGERASTSNGTATTARDPVCQREPACPVPFAARRRPPA